MDLLKYLVPMKDLPKRFSNLAFWRDTRKFKDEVVNAFEYVDSWGTSIENELQTIGGIHKVTTVTITNIGTASGTVSTFGSSGIVAVLDANSYTVSYSGDISKIAYCVLKLPVEFSTSTGARSTAITFPTLLSKTSYSGDFRIFVPTMVGGINYTGDLVDFPKIFGNLYLDVYLIND